MPPADELINNLGAFVAAAGALGTACFGIMEGLKWTPLGEAGFGRIKSFLTADLLGALSIAYGPQSEGLLRAQYREDSQSQSAIAKTLRQGIRIGLTSTNAAAIARFLGTVDPQALSTAAENIRKGMDLSSADRFAIGRFELAVDARIDSALAKAKDDYLGTIRCTSALLAVLIAELIAAILGKDWRVALVLGVMAVPFAPIANDVVGAVQAATKALRGR